MKGKCELCTLEAVISRKKHKGFPSFYLYYIKIHLKKFNPIYRVSLNFVSYRIEFFLPIHSLNMHCTVYTFAKKRGRGANTPSFGSDAYASNANTRFIIRTCRRIHKNIKVQCCENMLQLFTNGPLHVLLFMPAIFVHACM